GGCHRGPRPCRRTDRAAASGGDGRGCVQSGGVVGQAHQVEHAAASARRSNAGTERRTRGRRACGTSAWDAVDGGCGCQGGAVWRGLFDSARHRGHRAAQRVAAGAWPDGTSGQEERMNPVPDGGGTGAVESTDVSRETWTDTKPDGWVS